jgi:hypothetical protein
MLCAAAMVNFEPRINQTAGEHQTQQDFDFGLNLVPHYSCSSVLLGSDRKIQACKPRTKFKH